MNNLLIFKEKFSNLEVLPSFFLVIDIVYIDNRPTQRWSTAIICNDVKKMKENNIYVFTPTCDVCDDM